MAIYQLDDLVPQIHESVYVATSAEVIGDVHLAEGVSVWSGVVIRGDSETIRIGRGSNVQDLSMLHADPGVPLTIGDNVTIGHQVMLHGCTIGDESLIGIGAVVLNGAKIGKNCLVGAGSLVTEGKEIPDGHVFTQPWPAGETDKRKDQVIYYQYRADRARRALRGITEQVAKAEKAVAGAPDPTGAGTCRVSAAISSARANEPTSQSTRMIHPPR